MLTAVDTIEAEVRGRRGHEYGKPVATMKAYLEAMGEFQYGAPPPPQQGGGGG